MTGFRLVLSDNPGNNSYPFLTFPYRESLPERSAKHSIACNRGASAHVSHGRARVLRSSRRLRWRVQPGGLRALGGDKPLGVLVAAGCGRTRGGAFRAWGLLIVLIGRRLIGFFL